MIIHDVCSNEDGCLIIRGKKTVKRPKRFIAKHDHCYKMIKQRQYQNRTEHDIYFNLSIYKQLIVANKTYIHIVDS